MEIHKIRKDFPIFQCPPGQGKRLVYLDSGATSQKPQAVIDAVVSFYTTSCSNVHRALYELGECATTSYETARDTVAAFINANKREEIIFTKGTTEGINFIAAAWAARTLKPGDEIVVTQAEHHSNLLPWQFVAQQTGAKLVFVSIDPKTFCVKNPTSVLSSKTKLVAITQSSNVIGPIWDSATNEFENFIATAHKHGALVLIDAAQSIAHKKIDVQKLGADFLVFSGHKVFGPTGIGVLYINHKHHAAVEPYQRGGGMVFSVEFNDASWADSPLKYEAGTPPIAQAIGLGAAIDYMNKNFDYAALHKHEASLCSMLIDGLQKMPRVKIAGNIERLRREGHLVSMAFEGAHPHDIASMLGSRGVATRAGHHCAQPLAKHLGFESLLRVSIAAYNTTHDIEIFLMELEQSLKTL
jgi:cysteine desulfurase / selenocysteine lyase